MEDESQMRVRLNRRGEASTHQSMMKSLLCEMTGTMSADAAEGHTTFLRIRERLGAINANRTKVNPGRSAVDARFALGYSDDAYLNMACIPVWVGPGADEAHDLVTDLPLEVRRASAIGMLTNFKSLLAEQRQKAERDVSTVAAYVGWLLSVPEVREAALASARATGRFGPDGQEAGPIAQAYRESTERGTGELARLAAANPVAFGAILEALHMLLDPNETPQEWAKNLEKRHVHDVVRSALAAERKLAAAFAIMGPNPNTWCGVGDRVDAGAGVGIASAAPPGAGGRFMGFLTGRGQPAQPGQPAPTGAQSLSKALASTTPESPGSEETAEVPDDDDDAELADLYCPAPVSGGVNDKQMREALYAAWRRLSGNEVPANGSEWERFPGPSPFWSAFTPDTWSKELLKEQFALGDRATVENLREELDADFIRDVTQNLNVAESSARNASDESFVRYVLLRGVCALRGPHEAAAEAAGDAEQFMRYTFPRGRLYVDDVAMSELEPPKEPPVDARDAIRHESLRVHWPQALTGVNEGDAASPLLAAGQVANDPKMAPFQEPARAVRWAPVNSVNPTERTPLGKDPREPAFDSLLARARSKACALEVLVARLTIEIGNAPPDSREAAPLRTVRAALKLRQLESLSVVAKSEAEAQGQLMTAARDDERLVTRPAVICADNRLQTLSVAPGLVRFVRKSGATGSNGLPAQAASSTFNTAEAKTVLCDGSNTAGSADLTKWLRAALGDDTVLHVGAPPTEQPFTPSGASRGSNPFGEARKVSTDRVKLDAMLSVVRSGLSAVGRLKGIAHEEDLLRRLDDPKSNERSQILGLSPDPETQSRERRGALWEECMRHVSTSTDRLLAFARKVSGKLGEDVNDVLAASDEEMEAAQKELNKYRKQLFDRTLAFQTNLVNTVMGAATRSSKMQLDFDKGKHGDASWAETLVVVNTDLRDAAEKLSSTQDNRAFFQTGLQLKNLIDERPESLTLGGLLTGLMNIGADFHNKLAAELSNQPGQRLSLETLTKPHNLYLVKFRPDFYAALGTAFVSFNTSLETHAADNHYMPMRSIRLWELVETDPTFLSLNETFSAYVALALQWTRNNASNRVAYTSKYAHEAVAVAGKSVRKQLIHQACQYLTHHSSPPRFLAAGGREAYYGGQPDRVVPQPPCDPPIDYSDPPRTKHARLDPPDEPDQPEVPYTDIDPDALDRALDRLNRGRRTLTRRKNKWVLRASGVGVMVLPPPASPPQPSTSTALAVAPDPGVPGDEARAIVRDMANEVSAMADQFGPSVWLTLLNWLRMLLQGRVEPVLLDNNVATCMTIFKEDSLALAFCEQYKPEMSAGSSNQHTLPPPPRVKKQTVIGRTEQFYRVRFQPPPDASDEEVSAMLNRVFSLPNQLYKLTESGAPAVDPQTDRRIVATKPGDMTVWKRSETDGGVTIWERRVLEQDEEERKIVMWGGRKLTALSLSLPNWSGSIVPIAILIVLSGMGYYVANLDAMQQLFAMLSDPDLSLLEILRWFKQSQEEPSTWYMYARGAKALTLR